MSIVTKTGDQGTTGLMYNRRVPKTHPRVEAYGTVDELNAALGYARALTTQPASREHLLATQKELVLLMGELAVDLPDRKRYLDDGYEIITSKATARLEKLIREIEVQNISFKGWATPGETRCAAALDLARVACRRSERRCWELQECGAQPNKEIMIYLNRLSDLLWLMARWEENHASAKATG